EQQARGRQVEQVDQRQLLAMELLDAGQQVDPCALLRVVRAALVRVLAVPQVGDLHERRDERLRKGLDVREPVGDRRLIRGGGRERVSRKRAPTVERELAAA